MFYTDLNERIDALLNLLPRVRRAQLAPNTRRVLRYDWVREPHHVNPHFQQGVTHPCRYMCLSDHNRYDG